MSDVVLQALIAAIALVVVALISTFGVRTIRGIRRIRDQVENDHDTNLREENDHRHSENQWRMYRMEQSLTRIDGTLGRMADVILQQGHDIDELQDTIGRKKDGRHDEE